MIDTNPTRSAAREMKRKEQLGTEEPCCLFCGVRDWEMHTSAATAKWLLERGIPAKLLQDHHVMGRAHDKDFTAPLCLNDHALVTEDYRRAGVSMRPAPDKKSKLIRQLLAFAAFHERAAEALRRLADDSTDEED